MRRGSTAVRDVTLAILAGGEGSRMGYPKGELRLGGRPILPVLLERFAWEGPTLLVTAPGREHPTGWERFTREVSDPVGGQGPLRGVLTALQNSGTGVTVVAAVDMPRVGPEQLRWVARVLRERSGAEGLMLRHEGQVQPLPAAFRTTAAALVRRALESNRCSLHGLMSYPSVVATDAPRKWGQEIWTNLNSPDDLTGLDSFRG
jgi:molybdopterin-guanine dinucleotide biosynthesis protein A